MSPWSCSANRRPQGSRERHAGPQLAAGLRTCRQAQARKRGQHAEQFAGPHARKYAIQALWTEIGAQAARRAHMQMSLPGGTPGGAALKGDDGGVGVRRGCQAEERSLPLVVQSSCDVRLLQ